MQIKGIIFDYGGTIDSGGLHWSEVIWQSYSVAGVPVTKEQFRIAYVEAERELERTNHILPSDNFHALMLKKIRIELAYLADIGLIGHNAVERYTAPVARYCHQKACRCVEQARTVLEPLADKYPMALVSNFYGNIETVLRDFDLRRYFKYVIESAAVGVRKPDTAIFRLGVSALGLEPEQVLVVGDSFKNDILPASSIGCRTTWLKNIGWNGDENIASGTDIIYSLPELLFSKILQ